MACWSSKFFHAKCSRASPASAKLQHVGAATQQMEFGRRLQFEDRIALGEIGVILAYEATRLARNCTHWYQLLDLCGHAGCLIADPD